MSWLPVLSALGLAVSIGLLACPGRAQAQDETLTGVSLGGDTSLTFAHLSLPGATGIDFRFLGAFAPAYPVGTSHTVVMTFEWGATDTGPWSSSPDHAKTVPGGATAFFDSGWFQAPHDAPFVRIHFYAGGLMLVSGIFSHASVVAEPASATLLALGLGALAWGRRRLAAPG